MAAGQIEVPKVVVFEESDPLWRELAEEGAQEAGWNPQSFSNPYEALDAFDADTRALITALGSRAVLGGDYPAEPLIRRSNVLSVPRALLSGHPRADNYIRQGMPDIVIPKRGELDIPNLVTTWLVSLSQQ